ncbi:glutamate--tRNA ligase family protein, partial [Olsenella profusa]
VRPPAVRLRVPDEDDPTGTIALDDLCYGPHEETLAHDCGDFLVERSDGVIAYQLAVVVDDGLMGVTQVVRGNDLLGSSARQAHLARLLGFAPPAYGHVPLLMGADGRRLSKRDHDLDLGALRAAGVSPRRVVGRLAALVGLAEPDEEVDPEKLVGRFSWETLRAHRTN